MEERKHVSAHNLIGYATCLHIDNTLLLAIKVQVRSTMFISAPSVIDCTPETYHNVTNLEKKVIHKYRVLRSSMVLIANAHRKHNNHAV